MSTRFGREDSRDWKDSRVGALARPQAGSSSRLWCSENTSTQYTQYTVLQWIFTIFVVILYLGWNRDHEVDAVARNVSWRCWMTTTTRVLRAARRSRCSSAPPWAARWPNRTTLPWSSTTRPWMVRSQCTSHTTLWPCVAVPCGIWDGLLGQSVCQTKLKTGLEGTSLNGIEHDNVHIFGKYAFSQAMDKMVCYARTMENSLNSASICIWVRLQRGDRVAASVAF